MDSTDPHETRAHRERGRGRKAFWIGIWGAVIAGVLYVTWTPREPGRELTVESVDSALALSSAIWSELTPEQRAELVATWNDMRQRRWR